MYKRQVEKDEGQTVLIDPIINVEHVYFKDIVGYELQKQKLIENTEADVYKRQCQWRAAAFGRRDNGNVR